MDYSPEAARHSTESRAKNIAESNNLGLVSLSMSVAQAEKTFKLEKDKQGPIGNSVDWLKNNLGASAESNLLAGRAWSWVLNSDNGSAAVQRSINAHKAMLSSVGKSQSFDDDSFSGITGTEQNKADSHRGRSIQETVEGYQNSQKQSVEMISGLAAFGAVAFRPKPSSIAVAALEGAAVKAGVKYIDGAYSNPIDDATSGAIIGAGVPLARAAGFATNIGARLAGANNITGMAVTRFGAEGAVLGYTQEVSARYSAGRDAGLSISQAMNDSLIAPHKSTGALAGLGLGLGFGLLAGPVLEAQAGFAYTGARRISAGESAKQTVTLHEINAVPNPSLLKDMRSAAATGKVTPEPKPDFGPPRRKNLMPTDFGKPKYAN